MPADCHHNAPHSAPHIRGWGPYQWNGVRLDIRAAHLYHRPMDRSTAEKLTREPVSKLAEIVVLALPAKLKAKFPIYPSCINCNSIASAKVFNSIKAKREHIHARMRAKYKRTLSVTWTEEQIRELGYNLQIMAREQMREKQWLTRRLTWQSVV